MVLQSLLPLRWRVLAYAAAVLLAACASPLERGDEHAQRDDWPGALEQYRLEVQRNPRSIEARSRLKRAELRAADQHYQRGQHLLAQGDADGAVSEFQQGLIASPHYQKLQQALTAALARKEAEALRRQAVALRTAGRHDDAARLLGKALELDPDQAALRALAAEIASQPREGAEADEPALDSRAPVTLNFRQTDLRAAFEFLAKSFGLNVVFDDGLRSVPVTLFAKDVQFEQGLSLLLQATRTFHRRLGANTIVVIPDTREKRAQYEDHLVRTFYLNTARAKEMADLLKTLLPLKRVTVNETLNTLTVRDSEDMIALARRAVELNDRRPAEIMLEVEILEINRNKVERLGLDLGSYSIGASVLSGAVPAAGSISDAIRANAIATLPSATLRLFKQDVDAKTLANPRIRTLNGKAAKIHIGDRVPLRSATVQDATGQVRTTFDYREIGIRLNVEPLVHLDNSATVKLALEVSTLGENRGTPSEPAYAIGTRNAETVMVLRDGETAVLGGLIRDAERRNRAKVPGLGDVPVLGAALTSYDDSDERTDVLLTITPRVIRGWDVAGANERQFYSGTENSFSSRPAAAALSVAAGRSAPGPLDAASAPAGAPPARAATAGLGFGQPMYEAGNGTEFEIAVVASGVAAGSSLSTDVLFNPQVLAFVRGEAGDGGADGFKAEATATPGVVRISARLPADTSAGEGVTVARLVMRAAAPGISYLIHRAPTASAGGAAAAVNAQASRVAVK